MRHRIIIRNVDRPRNDKPVDEFKWICDSLGLMNGRDTGHTSFKIMYELLDLFSKEDLISTDEISRALKIEAPTVNHHLRTLSESGIIFREKRKIALRGGSLTSALQEMKKDSQRMFDDLIAVSKEIDRAFNLDR